MTTPHVSIQTWALDAVPALNMPAEIGWSASFGAPAYSDYRAGLAATEKQAGKDAMKAGREMTRIYERAARRG